MARFLIAILLSMSACTSSDSICDYDLAADGWVRAPSHPESLDAEYNTSSIWFKNSNGDFLSCASMKSGGICQANYELHKKLPNGGFDTDIIVCMR
jgi:hypothetical protein